ncbi:hypothetical protein JJC00_08240 [Bradyrhizobium diazoefficiens]|uniref:hypothetical protein n=1 Tax=Bradyrhizobium diazoefficiens TaxID=1355477 RepID=UPI00190B27A8|nr:hypothetical protein [Bradyrhizobium diazoefficiens]QQO35582.1 hypothetical protein JJC00_08240 [Bradyrhizobium diazoefficiens]
MIDSTKTKRRSAPLKPKPQFYGAPVGILMFERPRDPYNRPFIPGSVGNASTWSVPVRYKALPPGVSFDRILGPNAGDLEPVVAQAATELVAEGAQLITSNCGFMIRYQEAVRAAVDVPVLLSSLLLGPFLERMLPQDRALGIVTATASSLTPDLLAAAGLCAKSERVVVVGLEAAPAFTAAFVTCSGDLDISAVETETIDAAVALLSKRPDIGILLLECSELPPYAAAVQRATGIPVFDFTSMVEFFVRGLRRSPFNGLD